MSRFSIRLATAAQARQTAGQTQSEITASIESEAYRYVRTGLTGHEALDKTGITHTNGRLYDPVIGRFLNADPFVQSPGFSQSHNRYSYVMNNPTGFTDPSGYSCVGIPGERACGYDDPSPFPTSRRWVPRSYGRAWRAHQNMLDYESAHKSRIMGYQVAENEDTRESDDIVGTPEMDQLAVVTLNSYPQKQPYELRTEIYRNEDGNLEARPPTKLGPFGGAQLVDMKNVEGIAHTHPYFTRRQGERGDFDARATNRKNRGRGKGDHLPVVNNGVPNYIRTPQGDAVIVVERIDGRIQTRTVWER